MKGKQRMVAILWRGAYVGIEYGNEVNAGHKNIVAHVILSLDALSCPEVC